MMRSWWKIKNAVLSLLGRRTVGVRALVIQDDRILLVQHSYMPGWYSVGGAVDRGETPLQALARELNEEVGITLSKAPELFGAYYSGREGRDDYCLIYVVRGFEQKLVNSREIAKIEWFDLANLPQDVSPATRRRIEEFRGMRQVGDIW